MKPTDVTERASLEERFDAIQVSLRQHDAYHLDHKIQRVLHGVGFEDSTFQQPVVQLSGGQQNRLMLAKLLLSAPDVMLLDEPSNHLDIDATTWLEEYLVTSRQTLIVVSHDRYFLDRVTDRTLELFNGTVVGYRGNFLGLLEDRRSSESSSSDEPTKTNRLRLPSYRTSFGVIITGRNMPRQRTVGANSSGLNWLIHRARFRLHRWDSPKSNARVTWFCERRRSASHSISLCLQTSVWTSSEVNAGVSSARMALARQPC